MFFIFFKCIQNYNNKRFQKVGLLGYFTKSDGKSRSDYYLEGIILNNASTVFEQDNDASAEKKQQEATIEKLYAEIGQREVEIAWLKKKLL